MSNTPEGGPVPFPTTPPAVPLPQQAPEPSILDSAPLPPSQSPLQPTGQEIVQKAPKKLFTLDMAVPVVKCRVHLPALYPDYEPWTFTFRTSFSSDMEKKRDAFLALPPSKQAEGEVEELLNECADLLAEDPTGFGDWPEGLQSPGDKLKAYYQRAQKNPVAFPLIKSVLTAANNIYWAKTTPREFFPPPTDSRA